MNIQNATVRFLENAGAPLYAKETPTLLKSEGATPYGAPSRDKAMSFVQAAEVVLQFFADGQPMHYRKITKHAMDQGWLNTEGTTPGATMNAQLAAELKRAKASGEPGRLVRTSPGYYSLARWVDPGLQHRILDHNQEIGESLRTQLLNLNPAQFEGLIGELLAEMGFDRIEVTKSSGDSLDVRGTLLIGHTIRIKMAVQAKRWKSNVSRPTVQKMRGSLAPHEQGLIVTTSAFSPGALEEANRPDKTPVSLMNGEQLVALLMEYSIGVHRTTHNLFELKNTSK